MEETTRDRWAITFDVYMQDTELTYKNPFNNSYLTREIRKSFKEEFDISPVSITMRERTITFDHKDDAFVVYMKYK